MSVVEFDRTDLPKRTDPAAPRLTPPDGGPDLIDAQLAQLEARLLAEAGGDAAREQQVRDCLAAALALFAGAKVRLYLPILVERRARQLLVSA